MTQNRHSKLILKSCEIVNRKGRRREKKMIEFYQKKILIFLFSKFSKNDRMKIRTDKM